WIIVKLFLTVAMTILLLLHIQPISYLAGAATSSTFSNIQESGSLIQIISKAGAAMLGLIAITTISVYKPWGRTKNNNIQPTDTQKKKKPLSYYLLIGFISLMMILIAVHLFGGGMKH
ncbi:MAG TPA: hypothetical protein VN698_05250, partial [Bacteroidia bacterium]|nr:hypothetical protein [Bacteroidia bacterium]